MQPILFNSVLSFVNTNHQFMRFTLIFLLASAIPAVLTAQKYTLSGYMKDASSGEPLLGASIYVNELKQGTATNTFGFYSLTLPEGEYEILFSYVGYVAEKATIKLDQNISLSVSLESNVELDEVVIEADGTNTIQEKTQMSSVTITMEKVKTLPALFGERDLIKTLQLLPGVQSGGEGSSGLYVRGGGPDQNLILLDGVPVYNASHLFGFFSVFNADAINQVELIKGGFPARYGGRLSSVLDIRMKEGNMNEFKGEGSVGIISSKLSLEGPIVKDKTSFIVSGRRTYIDLLARPLIRATARNQGGSDLIAGYYFYDFNAKINHKFSDRSRLYLSGYLGDDKFYFNVSENYLQNGFENTFKSKGDLKWGNSIAALRWNYQFSPKLFSNTTITYSKYKFSTGLSFEETYRDSSGQDESSRFVTNFFSGIDDITAKVDFDFIPSPRHYIRFGLGDIYHRFSPGAQQLEIDAGDFNQDSTIQSQVVYAHEAYAYIEDDWQINEKFKANFGLYATAFTPSDTAFFSLQPRLSLRYMVGKKASLKASYAKMVQHLHLLTNPSIGLPTDLWVPATRLVTPEVSHQVAIGYAQTVKDQYEFSLEGYYKTMSGLIEYRDGQSFQGQDQDWEKKVESGTGESYGMEVLLQKSRGKFSGWIGYTLSWSYRQFENINFGERFPYRYDRRHDIGMAFTYKPSDELDIGIVWVYGTGNAYTLGLERYMAFRPDYSFFGREIEHIESRNNFRAPAYHRLDIGANLHKETKWGVRTWSFGFYNAYSRLNPFYIYWGYEDSFNGGDSKRVLKQISLFPIIPSISYSFKF